MLNNYNLLCRLILSFSISNSANVQNTPPRNYNIIKFLFQNAIKVSLQLIDLFSKTKQMFTDISFP